MPTLTYQIASSRGDSREDEAGQFRYQPFNILLGGQRRWTLFRFVNVQVPQGAIITAAYIKLTAITAPSGTPPNISLYGEKTGSPTEPAAAEFSTGTEISARSRTTSVVSWTSPNFATPLQRYTSPDIKAIIQEIVGQTAWRLNNPLHIIADVGITSASNYNAIYAYDGGPSNSAILEITYELPANATKKRKRFLHKVYNGNAYIGTIDNGIITNQPSFSWAINGGMGEMTIDLALTLLEFQQDYEGQIISFGYRVKTYVQGTDEATATQIYDGLITGYEPTIDSIGNEKMRVRVLSMATQLENKLLKSGSNTEVAYASQEPADIIKDIVDKIASNVAYTTDSVEDTGTTVSYTFNFSTGLEAIKKTLELCPAYWYWYLAADSTLHLHPSDFDLPTHTLYVGKHVQSINARKSIDTMKNAVYVKGGGSPPLYRIYERTSSISEYGRREERYSDERITTAATAALIAAKILDEKDHPLSIVTAVVIDNSYESERGYDIESLRPGDIVQIIDPRYETQITKWSDGASGGTFDIDFWDYNVRYSLGLPMQIRQINYAFHSATIELTAQVDDINKRIEDIKRNLDTVRTEDLPAAPS